MALLTQYAVLQLLDMLTTLMFLSAGVEEGNPIVAQAIKWVANPFGALLGVKLVALAMGFYCWSIGRHTLLRRANWLFAVLVMWNVVAICVATRHIS
jgi:hypothetical protein